MRVIPRAPSFPLPCFNVVVSVGLDFIVAIEMSFIPVSPENHFPVKNLPYGVFSTSDNVSTSRDIADVLTDFLQTGAEDQVKLYIL